MADAPGAEAARLVELLGGDAQARQRAYAELESVDAAVTAEPALVEALVGSVCSERESSEYRQILALILDFFLRPDGGFDAEFLRKQRLTRTWEAPALFAVASKPPEDLTRDDALAVASGAALMLVLASKGWGQLCERAGVDEIEVVTTFVGRHPLLPQRSVADPSTCRRLTELTLDLVRDPQGLTDREIAGAWWAVFYCTTQRPELIAMAMEGGLFEIGAAELRESQQSQRLEARAEC